MAEANKTIKPLSPRFIARWSWIDSAAVYGMGHSEEAVAFALRTCRARGLTGWS